MLSVHVTKGVSETPDAAKAVFAELTDINEPMPVVLGMPQKGQQCAIVHIAHFFLAKASCDATIQRLGFDDSPDAA